MQIPFGEKLNRISQMLNLLDVEQENLLILHHHHQHIALQGVLMEVARLEEEALEENFER